MDSARLNKAHAFMPIRVAYIYNEESLQAYYMNPAKRNVLDLKNETCKNREKRNVLKISHTRHFKTTKSSPKRAAFIVLNGKQTAFK